MTKVGMDVVVLKKGKRVSGRVVSETGCTPCQKQYLVERDDNNERFWVRAIEVVEWTYPEDWEGPIII